jgi:hypothetical protein
MKQLLASALILLALGGCGRVGSPVRRQPAPPPTAEASVTPAEEPDSEKDTKEKNP